MSKCKCVVGETHMQACPAEEVRTRRLCSYEGRWALTDCPDCGGSGEAKPSDPVTTAARGIVVALAAMPALNLPPFPVIDWAKEPTIEAKREWAEAMATYRATAPLRALAEAVAVPAAIEWMKQEWVALNPHGRVTWDVRKGSTLQVEFSLGGEKAFVLFVLDRITEDSVFEALGEQWRSIGASLARRWKP